MKKSFLSILLVLVTGWALAQRPLKPAELVTWAKGNGLAFVQANDLVQASATPFSSRNGLQAEVTDAVLLDLDATVSARFATDAPEAMVLALPLPGGLQAELELVKVDIFAPGFFVNSTDHPGPIDVPLGAHYRGVIKGVPGSLAAISVFDEEIAGIFSAPRAGNYVIGKLQQGTARTHIVYNDKDLVGRSDFACGTEDDGRGYTESQLLPQPATRALTDCIRNYFEVDADIVSNKGGVSGATSYITGAFNQMAILYANESMNFTLSQVFCHTTSPYTGTTSSAMLSQFQTRTSAINGDLGHLVSYKASGGIAAGFSGLCNSNVDNKLCFSNIYSTYSNVPTYSWTIMVMTHEMGHLVGSRHTHACVWNGNNTAIDGCAGGVEGTCALPGYPAGGGTIMSYCHLQSVGINLALGFGTQPGNVIRNSATNATCLSPCGGGGGTNCTATVSTYPYSESFETSFGGWSNGTGDDFDWTRLSGATPTASTGPDAAYTGSFYAYIESSSPNYPSKTAILTGPCFDLSTLASPVFNFRYHMYGASTGSLFLEASTNNGTSWTAIWSASGNKGNSWLYATVGLGAYSGGNVRLRFRGTTTTSFTGDIGIDAVNLSGTVSCYTVNVNMTFDNYPEETSWELRNSANAIVASGGTYGTQADGSSLTVGTCQPAGCYTFIMKDVYGDGMCCSYGNGSYTVTSGGVTLASGGTFTTSQSTSICLPAGSGTIAAPNTSASTPLHQLKAFTIAPNPTQGELNVVFESNQAGKAALRIVDLTGRTLLAEDIAASAGLNKRRLDLRDLPAGAYLIRVQTLGGQVSSELIVLD
jgi:hypothetical protein